MPVHGESVASLGGSYPRSAMLHVAAHNILAVDADHFSIEHGHNNHHAHTNVEPNNDAVYEPGFCRDHNPQHNCNVHRNDDCDQQRSLDSKQ